MKTFSLGLLSGCSKHHVEKTETIWRVADNFGWALDRFNLPPGAATRSREPGVIQQVAQQAAVSCKERVKVAERKAAERVLAAESDAGKWKTANIKWKKMAAERQLEICALRQQNENLTAEIRAPLANSSFYLFVQIGQGFQKVSVLDGNLFAPMDTLELAGVFSY